MLSFGKKVMQVKLEMSNSNNDRKIKDHLVSNFCECPMFHIANAVDNVTEVKDSKMQIHELY